MVPEQSFEGQEGMPMSSHNESLPQRMSHVRWGEGRGGEGMCAPHTMGG